MIRSLYIRVVLTFLISVIAGTIIAFVITFLVFRGNMNENVQEELLSFGQDIVRIYETIPLREADKFVGGMKQLNSYHIRIYDEENTEVRSYGTLGDQASARVSSDQVKNVLNGEIVRADSSNESTGFVGLPLMTEAGAKALFIQPLLSPYTSFNVRWLSTFLIYSLVIGSLLILIASIFVVKPINKLTKATKRLASGDFNVRLNIRQTGELGALARSFEEMTHDLQHLEQMRREFVANVSHEVQSPLTSISGYAQTLKQVNLAEHERDRYLDIISAEAKRMSKMSDSLLKLSLLESDSQSLRFTERNLDEQIRRVIVALQPQWTARNMEFELDLQAIKVTADHDQLDQVWMNILGNGIKFSEDDGTMAVSMRQVHSDVIIRISDNGIGIEPEDQQRIFERFFKADRSHGSKYEGSGMGLAIVKQIVSLHKGDIQVESKPGEGTTFVVTLPMHPAEKHR
ncbi:cell wall metabolism sensor histidine kinase WalK [Paenibacillus illinoisensis]|uniref:sensor histidine kinase n=1 Tax=Paenibacillus illinoisensis TaxID=59845 RepID=UPI001C8DE399|nr:HAMP domain-containing sensor histidine kinase [Paenibacillus illinoisensis]MBY0219111.1 HAMP domain-containing histidine kinase [Paenibacillus illinoisensis]